MDIDIKDKRVVVTAGAHGIGLAIADTFSRAGAQVHVCDVNDAFLAEATQRLPGVTQSRTDVADQEQVGAMFDTLEKRWGALDVLINNAGIAGPTASSSASYQSGGWRLDCEPFFRGWAPRVPVTLALFGI